LRIALELRARADRTDERLDALGDEPTATRPGSGVLGAIFTELRTVTTKLDSVAAAIEADRQARAEATRRREPLGRLAWIIIGAGVGTATTGAVGAIGYWLARHWQ
jgi:hypothetical protein